MALVSRGLSCLFFYIYIYSLLICNAILGREGFGCSFGLPGSLSSSFYIVKLFVSCF